MYSRPCWRTARHGEGGVGRQNGRLASPPRAPLSLRKWVPEAGSEAVGRPPSGLTCDPSPSLASEPSGRRGEHDKRHPTLSEKAGRRYRTPFSWFPGVGKPSCRLFRSASWRLVSASRHELAGRGGRTNNSTRACHGSVCATGARWRRRLRLSGTCWALARHSQESDPHTGMRVYARLCTCLCA